MARRHHLVEFAVGFILVLRELHRLAVQVDHPPAGLLAEPGFGRPRHGCFLALTFSPQAKGPVLRTCIELMEIVGTGGDNGRENRDFSTIAGDYRSLARWSTFIVSAGRTLDLAEHVQGDPAADRRLSSDPVDRLLHLAMPAVAPFHRVGGRTQQAVVEEGQGLLQVGGLELLEDRSHPFEVVDLSPQPSQLPQGRLSAAPAVEQPVDLLHHSSEGPQLRQTPSDASEYLALTLREVPLHEQMAMLEQVPDLPLQMPASPGLPSRLRCAGGPRGSSGCCAARCLRTRAMARRTALFSSARIWKRQT